MAHTILLMFLTFYFRVILRVDAIPELQAKRWNSSLGTLIMDILDNHFPRCELVLLQDKFFASAMNSWLLHFPHPYYSLTLDDKPVPDYTTWSEITRAGFNCTTIIAVCLSFSTCRNKDSKALFTMLRTNGILLKDRRALLYVDSETANDYHYAAETNETIQVKFSIPPLSYQKQDAKEYTIPALNSAKKVLQELNSHITVIRKMCPVRANSKKTIYYETTTFSPNWLPGGTPVLKNFWSSTNDFSFPAAAILDLKSIRSGGTARFCVSSKELLPMFYYHEGEELRGVEGEMIKIFLRRFQMNIRIFEPNDNDFGQKEKSGNWTGVIGNVMRKEADFGVGQITFTLDRYLSGLKFTPSLLILTAVAICPSPKLKSRLFIMVQPFDWISWLCLGMTTVVIVGILQGMQAVSKRLNKPSSARKYYVPWVQMVGPIIQRSVHLVALPRLWATIALMSTWLVTANIISLFYLSILIGALSVPTREPYVTSPYDIIKRDIPCATLPVAYQALVDSTIHNEQMMYHKCLKLSTGAGLGTPEVKAFKFMTNIGGCTISEKLRANYLVGRFSRAAKQNDNQKSNSTSSRIIYVSREAIFIGPTGWAMRSDMDFLMEHYFDRVFRQFRAQGLLLKTMEDFSLRTTSTTDINNNKDTPFKPLALEAIEPIFIAALLCFIASALVLGVEILFHKRQMRRKKRRKFLGNPNILP